MDKYKETFGVDISKDVFDVYGSDCGHSQFNNDSSGFKLFVKTLAPDVLVVMEATGYYHYRLAQFLYKNGIAVSVVNPLSVKRFIHLSKLLKQAFTIAKSGFVYDVSYRSTLAKN